MWTMIHSLQPLVEALQPAFTLPSAATNAQLLLGWVMCLGHHTLRRVAHTGHPEELPDHSRRHGLDPYYNFFERSAWVPQALAYRVAVLILTRLDFLGGVVLAVAVCLPGTGAPILALPLLARLYLPGKGQPSCPELARQMLAEVLAWSPGRRFTLVGDGAYACKALLGGLDERVTFVGRLRGDAALYDRRVPQAKPGKRGPKAKKGPRLPSPQAAAAKADRKRSAAGAWVWQDVSVTVYGCARVLRAFAYEAVWPRVLGLRPVRVVVVRDPEGRMWDAYLFTTDLGAPLAEVITQFAWRWSIEVLFRASKQVLDIEAPQHWSRQSVEKVAPWVWSMQSVIMVWYISAGRESAEAAELRERLGDWDSEWSLRHMIQVLRRAILNATIDPNSANEAELREMTQTLKNWANLAA